VHIAHHNAAAGAVSRPCAILISGAPATGKTTLAAALAPRLGAAVLDLDVATGPLTEVVSGLIGATDLSDPRLAELTRAPRYDTLFALAEDTLRAGTSVVLVAPFTVERSVAGWHAVVDRLAPYGDPVLVWLRLPPDRLIERLSRRAAARDAEKIKSPAAFLAAVDDRPPQAPHLGLDATAPVGDLLDGVLDYLARHGLAIDGKT
jgi:predicted kinase